MNRTAAAAAALLVMAGCHGRRSRSIRPSRARDLRSVVEGARRAPFQRHLAVTLAKQGQCAVALYHWQRAMRLTARKDKPPKVLADCHEKLMPRPVKRPAGMGQARLWRALQTPRVRLPAALSFYGSNDAQKAWVLSLCGQRAHCTVSQWPPLELRHMPTFSMGRTEVTIEQWNRCVRAGACSPRHRGPGRRPVTGVDMEQAGRYCRWKGGRLPTEPEWERAARSMTSPRDLWPWGNTWIAGCARVERPKDEGPADVGTYPCDLSDSGLVDMAGNVAEWVRASDAESKHGLGLVKGGSWSDPRWRAAPFARVLVPADRRDPHLGFRCVWPEHRTPRRRN